MGSLIFPPYLQEGDRVIVLSPSSKIDKSFLKGRLQTFEVLGAGSRIRKARGEFQRNVCRKYPATPRGLQEAMDDEEAKVIFCSRGVTEPCI